MYCCCCSEKVWEGVPQRPEIGRVRRSLVWPRRGRKRVLEGVGGVTTLVYTSFYRQVTKCFAEVMRNPDPPCNKHLYLRLCTIFVLHRASERVTRRCWHPRRDGSVCQGHLECVLLESRQRKINAHRHRAAAVACEGLARALAMNTVVAGGLGELVAACHVVGCQTAPVYRLDRIRSYCMTQSYCVTVFLCPATSYRAFASITLLCNTVQQEMRRCRR